MSDLLIIIDMQEGFRCKLLEKIIPNIKNLIKVFNGKIVFSSFENQNKSAFENLLKWKKFQRKKEKVLLVEFHKYKFPVFWHNSYTVLNNNIFNYIKKNGFNTLYLGGIYTDVCIIKTAMDCFDLGLKIKVIADCCISLHSQKHHNIAIDSIGHIIGKKNLLHLSSI